MPSAPYGHAMSNRPDPGAPFDLDHYLDLPRVSGLVLAPDGGRLVASVATVAPDGKRFVSSLWELDPEGRRAPRRLTRSAPGESGAAFLPDGSLLFTSARENPAGEAERRDGDDERPALWLLPAGGGEAMQVAATPAGIHAVRVARASGTVVYATGVHPGAETLEEDERRAKAAGDAGVVAQLIEHYPIRHWDHWLGPREPRLLSASPPADGEDGLGPPSDLTPVPGRALDEASFAVTPDGSCVVTTWEADTPRRPRTLLVALNGQDDRRVLIDQPGVWLREVACSPDGRAVVCQRATYGSREEAPEVTLWLVDLASGEGRDLLPGFEGWPAEAAWAPDGAALYFVADADGRTPVYRVELGGERGGQVTRLTGEGAYSDLCPAPDGRHLYALRSSLAGPPQAVALEVDAPGQEPRALPTPGLPLALPGTVAEVEATADDGTRVRSWLVLPPGAGPGSPAPLLVFIHGGPLSSWSDWSWRWNPQLLAARGYAVLLPDPALSTGYGQAFIERGRGRWGERPYTDLVAAVDAAVARPDVDGSRTAAMGGSFGGYMANWVAGHTGRFRCIVTHASIWSLGQFRGTTDYAPWWECEFGDPEHERPRYEANSPDRHADAIRTPMLVIHGERDHRVPISEALRLWTDLSLREVEAKFLYFPDENHWILKPQNVRVWYETVFAFLDHHVLGKEWTRPPLL
jgi:dipeptidyl aminopeptidase/acylaminoacyl peptidase